MTNALVRILAITSTAILLWASPRVIADETNPNIKVAAPADNLDYWLGQARPIGAAETRPAENPATPARGEFRRDDALPGVIEFSDGRRLAGGIYTTRDKPIMLWLDRQKRWRRIPLAAALSISAVIVQQEMKLSWRWKAMGQPERVYTGKSYPFRRFQWRVHLADGSYLQGVIKGQPIWVATPRQTSGPFILHERAKGRPGQRLDEQIYIRKIVISRKIMNEVAKRLIGKDYKRAATGRERGF